MPFWLLRFSGVNFEVFLMKKYSIIYADPPWSYKGKALSGNRGACCKYPVMDTEDIKQLPIKDIADKDCVFFYGSQCQNSMNVLT